MLPVYRHQKPPSSAGSATAHHSNMMRLPQPGVIPISRHPGNQPPPQLTLIRHPNPRMPSQPPPPNPSEFNVHIMKPMTTPSIGTTTISDFVVSNLKFHSSTAVNWENVKDKNEQVFIRTDEAVAPTTQGESQSESLPSFGEGSVYGFEARDAARRRRWAIANDKQIAQQSSQLNVKPPAWSLCVGQGKSKKTYHAVMEGRVVDNCAYFVMKQISNNRIEAYHVDDWYNMVPRIGYCYLNEEEAEEEFSKRHKTHNHFNTMMKRRLADKTDANGGESDVEDNPRNDGSANTAASRKQKGKAKGSDDDNFRVVEGSDAYSDAEDAESSEEDTTEVGPVKSGKKKTKPVKKGGKKKASNKGDKSEDSDLDDHDGDEIDYMSTSSDEDALPDDERAKIYAEGGVEDEKGLRKTLDDSGSLSEENEEEEEKEENSKEPSSPNEGSVNQGQEDSSDDDDEDEDDDFSSSDMEMDSTDKEKIAGQSKTSDSQRGSSSKDTGSSSKPGMKRGASEGEGSASSSKRSKSSGGAPPVIRGESSTSVLDKLPYNQRMEVEDLVRKYLLRKPITTSELIKKVCSKKILPATIDISQLMVAIISKLNPEKIKMKGVQKLHLRK